MTPLPAAMSGIGPLLVWRLDKKKHATTWDSGEGARRFGGRWNSRGRKAIYCSVDPATTILEVAVHHRFEILDTVPHVLTCASIANPAVVHVVPPDGVPNMNWLRPGTPSAGQQGFGDNLLTSHPFVLIPSAVSTHSWNLIFDPDAAKSLYSLHLQENFALDTRLHPPAP